MEKLADSRIRTRNENLPKVNRALAERLMQGQEAGSKKKRKRDEDLEENKEHGGDNENLKSSKKDKEAGLLMDPRFKAVFEDPEFEIDETSKAFALLHPSQADTAKKRANTAVDEEEEESSVGGMSSDDLGLNGSSEGESKEESSSSEEGTKPDYSNRLWG